MEQTKLSDLIEVFKEGGFGTSRVSLNLHSLLEHAFWGGGLHCNEGDEIEVIRCYKSSYTYNSPKGEEHNFTNHYEHEESVIHRIMYATRDEILESISGEDDENGDFEDLTDEDLLKLAEYIPENLYFVYEFTEDARYILDDEFGRRHTGSSHSKYLEDEFFDSYEAVKEFIESKYADQGFKLGKRYTLIKNEHGEYVLEDEE